MTRKLRLLLVEDMEDDALLLLRELGSTYDVELRRVWTREAMRAALGETWDFVISDWSLPGFSGLEAFELVREVGLDVPFVIVSGTINEENAVDALKAGVHDFMSKGKFARLVPTIERELREVELRKRQRIAQEQLMVSDRMASIGMLAAGVAHEINNPLAAVISNLELAASMLDDHERLEGDVRSEVCEMLADARSAADRVKHIIRDLKIFSRHEDTHDAAVDVRAMLESTLRMAWTEIRHRARLEKAYGETPPVRGTESRLGQVFLNLIVNAAQAIPEGNAARNTIRIVTGMDDERVFVEVTDTGSGMSEETVRHLFTPFFTTKPQGVGTGLGLSIAHRIVTGLGGELRVDTALGRGTTFRVILPVADQTTTEAPGQSPTPQARRGRILVVDDELVVLTSLRRLLSRDHEVDIASGASEALRKLADGNRYDVILCDLMMPQVTGMELHEHVQQHHGEQAERIIFLTGGAFTPSARQFLDRVPNQWIEKPFDVQQLRAMIKDKLR
jgi:signal transduction histidine kinase